MDSRKLASGLGWFSLGLGLMELIAPSAVARIVGARNHALMIRSYGLREIAAGAGILLDSQRPRWLWARLAGDLVDLASLGWLAGSSKKNCGRTIAGIASVAGVTLLDAGCARVLSRQEMSRIWARAEAHMIVDRPPEECYRSWRNLEDLPRFMSLIRSVRSGGDNVSHWVATGPAGRPIEWDAQITVDIPNERVAWESLDGSSVRHSGVVSFEPAPGGRGTIVRVQIDYGHCFRTLGRAAALLGRDPGQMIRKELRRFKQVMETGEVITTEGQPAGRRGSTTWLDRVAR